MFELRRMEHDTISVGALVTAGRLRLWSSGDVDMNPKERVHAALERRPVDRIPIFMWFHPSTAEHLAARLEIPVSRLGDVMGNDIRQAWVNNNYAMEGIVHEREGESHVDFWGVRWTRIGQFNQITHSPLAYAGEDQVLLYHFPTEHIVELMHQMDPVVAAWRDYFIGCDVSPCVFELYWRLRGLANALEDIGLNPYLAREMFRRSANFSIQLAEAACDCYSLDWLWTGDDVASQNSLIISPDCWREMVKPHLARVFAVGRAHRLPVAYHCCGALRPIIPDLIEIGMDVLNPVQCNCDGMDPIELKKEFGRQITFMGGVDTQRVLPYGTPEDVRRATAHLIEQMTGDGGGFILAASHTIPPETSDDNIFAMYAEAGLSMEEIRDRAADVRAGVGG